MAALPLAARAQRAEPMRRIGVLIEFDENDPEAKAYPSGLTLGLAQLGWTDGRNVRIDIRWAAGSVERMQMFAKELIDLQPDVIVASSTPVTAAVQRETQTTPIVFVTVADPIRAGFVASLARPGGNLTGFTNLVSDLELGIGFEHSGRGPPPTEQEWRRGVEAEGKNQHGCESNMHCEQAGHHRGHHRGAAIDAPSPWR